MRWRTWLLGGLAIAILIGFTFIGINYIFCAGERADPETNWATCNCGLQMNLGGSVLDIEGGTGRKGTAVVVGPRSLLTANHVVESGKLKAVRGCNVLVTSDQVANWSCKRLGSADAAYCVGPHTVWPSQWETPTPTVPSTGTRLGATGFGGFGDTGLCGSCCALKKLVRLFRGSDEDCGDSDRCSPDGMSHGELKRESSDGKTIKLKPRIGAVVAAKGDSGGPIFDQDAGAEHKNRRLVGIVEGKHFDCGGSSTVTCGLLVTAFLSELETTAAVEDVCGLDGYNPSNCG